MAIDQQSSDPSTGLAELLAALDNRTDVPREIEISALMEPVIRRIREAGLEPPAALIAEYVAFQFNENHPDSGIGWGTYYGPLGSFPGPNGERVEVPSIVDVTPEVLTYWSRRARDAKHPILRARYGDLAWEFGSKVAGAQCDHEGARIAIDAALEVAQHPGTAHLAGSRKLTRALQLARSLKDEVRSSLVRDGMIEFMSRTAEDDKAATWVYSNDDWLKGPFGSIRVKRTGSLRTWRHDLTD